ncbi:serine/threonine-protein kinase/endoribonuclease IRE1b-like [Rhodamnia argentea]|uniref:Serine/threonine-protein kinase/endoribonuclease IRE1b-like n=1 Tax=Rhodamnia argentea TaxID=178133 RepID=A0A8B8MXH9_9MYRT|nr:serine/threonine-protein kinase/endoribonuclease IRE1b-like [Rhodamnia argentea]
MGRLIYEAMDRSRGSDLGDGSDDEVFVRDVLRISDLKEIGKGQSGSTVYLGNRDGSCVSVKRFLKEHVKVDNQIIDLLFNKPHPNVVCPRSDGIQYDSQFGYIVQDLCHFSLADLVDALSLSSNFKISVGDAQSVIDYQMKQIALRDRMQQRGIEFWAPNTDCYPSNTMLKLMRDIAIGLHYLHTHGIVHGDLRAETVLIVDDDDGVLSAKISDVGITTVLQVSSRATAPELCDAGRPPTLQSDIFCLGCILYFCLSGGRHPYGDFIVRKSRIKKNKQKKDDPTLASLMKKNVEACELFNNLLSSSPHSR